MKKYAKAVLLELLLVEETPIVSLMVKGNEKNRSRFMQNIIKPLIDANLIEPTIKDNPNSLKQAYRLTEKSKQKGS